MSSGRGRGRRGGRGADSRPRERRSESAADEQSPLAPMFRQFAAQLDRKHDRYERLVKRSRDVTIESKRIIFMLHRVTKDEEGEQVLEEAAERFRQLEATTLREIAEELTGEDPYLYIRAISPGLQEYIEALSYYHYLLHDQMISWAEAQARLTYRPAADVIGPTADVTGTTEDKTEPQHPEQTETKDTSEKPPELCLLLPYHEYVLGIADLTGELMRKCISSVSSGELDQCWRLCAVLRTIHEGFVHIGNSGPREITRKLYTLRQSLAKVENACYQLRVRGEEIPQHMLADVFSAGDDIRDDFGPE